MDKQALEMTANALIAHGKGILAIDESFATIGRRFESISVANSERNRRSYRELLVSCPDLERYVSGMILFDETLRQPGARRPRLVEPLFERAIHVGIKVDTGAKAMAGHPGEQITEGLDGLRERLCEYHALGATFAKWRAVIAVDGNALPSAGCIEANAHALARYSAMCQEAGLVPIVEPEVLMDGNHSIDRCAQVTDAALRAVFAQLRAQRVHLEGVILKANMVVPGASVRRRPSAEQVAERTIQTLRGAVPAAVPGVVFLSGGQSEVDATARLNAMNLTANHPWTLSFSFGRALQDGALKAWAGKAKNARTAQAALLCRASLNSAACFGRYSQEMEMAQCPTP
jgi:fructose-bisphosphate aldolase class I